MNLRDIVNYYKENETEILENYNILDDELATEKFETCEDVMNNLIKQDPYMQNIMNIVNDHINDNYKKFKLDQLKIGVDWYHQIKDAINQINNGVPYEELNVWKNQFLSPSKPVKSKEEALQYLKDELIRYRNGIKRDIEEIRKDKNVKYNFL